MGPSKLFIPLLLAELALCGVRAHSQAKVTENQTVFVYVDGQNGSDNSPGTPVSPVKTIQAAINRANANNQKGIGTKVIIDPGVYRETVSINPVSNQTTVPLTVQAATAGTVKIAGSEVLSNWSAESGNPSIYSDSLPYNLAKCGVPAGWPTGIAPIALQNEMVFVNNIPLTQVLSSGDLRAGTFYVNQANRMIQVWPPPGTNMQTAVVEAAVRPKTLSVFGRTNVVLRGLVLRHASSCMNSSGATVTNGSNVLIDSVQVLWNNWGGLGLFSSSNVTVQNSTANYNGGVGFQASKDENVLFNSDESDYNNWRGAQAAFYEWGMGGAKLFQMRNTSVQNHVSYNNQAEGLWFDTDNQNINIGNAKLAGNLTAALQIERNEGPVTIENSGLCSSGVGLNVLTSEKMTVKNNAFYNNGGTGKWQGEIFIAGQPGGKIITDWQSSQTYDLFTTGMVLTGNTFQDASAGQNLFATYLSGSDWSQFADSLVAANNLWYSPFTASPFKIVNGKLVNLGGWQSVTGTDFTSQWGHPVVSPPPACAIPLPAYKDFNVSLDNRSYTMTAGTAVAKVRVKSFGFGNVTLTATGMPAGVSASIANPNLTSGVATLTLSASKTAVTQTLPITLWAIGNGRVHSVTFNLAVAHA